MSTLENAAAVLKLFQQKGVTLGHPGLTFTDVVEALRLPKSTVSRLLATMESQGMLERDAESRCFHIGRVLLAVSGHYLSAPLVDSASPDMARLADKTGCIGYISRLDGNDLVVMRMFHGRHFTQLITPPGSRLPAAATSTGRVLLAQFSEEEVRQRFENSWQPLPPNSPQTLDALCAQLAEIRQLRWSLARNETLPGISSLSVALHNKYHGDTVALCLSFLSTANALDYPPALLDQLRHTASDVAAKYGAALL